MRVTSLLRPAAIALALACAAPLAAARADEQYFPLQATAWDLTRPGERGSSAASSIT